MLIRVTVFKPNSHDIKLSYEMDYTDIYQRSRLGESSRDALLASEAILTQRVGG